MEEAQSMSEGPTYVCPVCGSEVPFFITSKSKSPVVKCPACGATIQKKQVPKESIIVDEELYQLAGQASLEEIVKLYSQKKSIVQEPKEEENEPKEELPTNPTFQNQEESQNKINIENVIEAPKSACECLKETLNRYSSINKDFINMMLNRCKQKEEAGAGGLTPDELYFFLLNMKSGVKTPTEARFIAEDYALALQKEAEKARKSNLNYPFWLAAGLTAQPNDTYFGSMMPQRIETNYPPLTPSNRFQPSQQQSMNQYAPPMYQYQQNNMSEIFRIISEMQKSNQELLLKYVETTSQTFMQNILKTLEDRDKAFAQILDAIAKELNGLKNNDSSNKLIEELRNEIKELKEEKEKKELQETLSNIVNTFAQQQKKTEEEINALKQQLETAKLSQYNSDQARLLSETLKEGINTVKEGIKTLAEVAKSRRPVQEFATTILPQIRKVKTSEDLITALKQENLIEEEEEEEENESNSS